MSQRVPKNVPVPPWGLAVAAMLSVQLSSALSVDLIAAVGPAGTAWLRLSMGALIFLAIARPPLRALRRHDVPVLLGLGVATGLMTIAFLASIERIPLGTAVAIEFLGPLTVAAVRSHSARALIWPALALLGVVLLTEPWAGDYQPRRYRRSQGSRPSGGPSTSCSPNGSATASRASARSHSPFPSPLPRQRSSAFRSPPDTSTSGSSPPPSDWPS